jgi:hypothetical protein
MRVLDQYDYLKFELYLFIDHDLFEPWEDHCSNIALCTIYFRKPYTPVVYTLSPPVVYFESETNIWFDAKNVPNKLSDIPTDELPFINAKIGGALMDFETYVDFDRTFSAWHRNYVTGRVGDQAPAKNHDFKLLWEVGQSHLQEQESLHCSYDNKTCYTT